MDPSTNEDGVGLAFALLASAARMAERIDEGVARRGFSGLRPTHGFAFAYLAPAGGTVTGLAAHLGVTKQAAAQLVDELEAKGYVRRGPHPRDARARLVELTEAGRACTRAAEEAAAEAAGAWSEAIGADRMALLRRDLERMAEGGPIRPTW
ncbi:MarR family transcriptional regulator [Nocardiopsis sp. RSe5-2]|uniref:MarR family transcriptional regulator n=1 Tax=Nocardiopsis endophytica TaxID=3018445 RepID=A0ABT4UDP8_9ACTN|nr:MarR family transcriptional regulator [Nocardiopsis endophytica]MDA2815110.1 MarR family transcriptional regulator [Nocardiopsis endophytica]